MNILMCSSEANPFFKTGGLADVVYSLSKEYVKLKHNVFVILPYYKKASNASLLHPKFSKKLLVKIYNQEILTNFYKQKVDGINYIFVENDKYFNFPNLYGFFNDGERFAFFTNAIISFIKDEKTIFDIVHVHDWQAGMIPCLIKEKYREEPKFNKIKTILTIHNPMFKGFFEKESLYDFFELDNRLFDEGKIEFDYKVSTLKSAIIYADKITTVSPTHAKELLTKEGGHGLDYCIKLREYDFVGILNGVDYDEFNPEKDADIFKQYSIDNFADKRLNKNHFIADNKLVKNRPIYSVISRLYDQKGLDIIAKLAEYLVSQNCIFAVLGSGEKYYEDFFLNLQRSYPKNVFLYIGYSNKIAHELYSASDFLIMPSLFEPCGISQMIAQRYGTLPIVRLTGGLKDSVIPYNEKEDLKNKKPDGFGFEEYDAGLALDLLSKTLDIYEDKTTFKKIIKNAMSKDNSWQTSAKKYLEIYSK